MVWCFLQVFRSSNCACIGKKGHRFQLCHQFLLLYFLGVKICNIPNELVHRAGPPFLDNHYNCGYQKVNFDFAFVWSPVIVLVTLETASQ